MKTSLLVACLTDTVAPEAGRAVVRVLEPLGHTADFRPERPSAALDIELSRVEGVHGPRRLEVVVQA